MNELLALARQKLGTVYRQQSYLPPYLSFKLNGLDTVANNEIRILWHFIYHVDYVIPNKFLIERIASLNNTVLEALSIIIVSDNFTPLHPASDWLRILRLGLEFEAMDGGNLIEDVTLFYKLLDAIMIHNQFYSFKTFAKNDIRFLTYRWADFCYSYREHVKQHDLVDLKAAYDKNVKDYNQVIEKEERREKEVCGSRSPIHAYGAFMQNFYQKKLSQYTIFTEADTNEYRSLKVKNSSHISDLIPYFTMSLLSRISPDYETLMSSLRRIYNCDSFIESMNSNNKLLSYSYPMTQVLIGLTVPQSNVWKEANQYQLTSDELSAVNNFVNTLSSPKINLIGRDQNKKVFSGEVNNPLCYNSPSLRDWTVTNNTFVYEPSRLNKTSKSIAQPNTNTLIYREVPEKEVQIRTDFNFAPIIKAGVPNSSYARKILVTNAEVGKLTKKKDNGKFGQFLDDTFNFPAIRKNSQIRILVGSSGAGKTTTISSALYVASYQQNIYPQDLSVISSTKPLTPIIPPQAAKPVSLSNTYFAIDAFKVIPQEKDSCTSIIRPSTENKSSSRNFNLWNMLLISSTASLTSYTQLIASKSFTFVDTMGFENVAIQKRGKIKLVNPIDLILYPLLSGEELELDNFSIPQKIEANRVTPWEIKDYHLRVQELVNSFTSLLKVTRKLDNGKLRLLPILKLNTSSDEYKELTKNEIISFLIDYNRPRYEEWKKLNNPKYQERIENSMTYDVDVTLLFNKNIERRRRDVQVFDLLKIFSSNPNIDESIAKIVTLEHIQHSSY